MVDGGWQDDSVFGMRSVLFFFSFFFSWVYIGPASSWYMCASRRKPAFHPSQQPIKPINLTIHSSQIIDDKTRWTVYYPIFFHGLGI